MTLPNLSELKHTILGMDFSDVETNDIHTLSQRDHHRFVSYVETDSVHTFSRRDRHRDFAETMHLWLKRSPQPTWGALFKALTKMGHHQLVENIKARLCSSK